MQKKKDRSEILNFIKEHCREQGITQAELAKRIGSTDVSICRYFSGIRIPNIVVVEKMLYAIGVNSIDISV